MFFTKKRTDGADVLKEYARIGLVDMHSHVLPRIDDGSESVERSIEMLTASYEQGVRKIVATPHFYPDMMSPADFLARRDASARALGAAIREQTADGNCLPTLYVGAEVAYFDGISRSEAVAELCISGTRLLLVEMPFGRWSESDVRELMSLKSKGFQPVVAHYDRYYVYQEKGLLERLCDWGIDVQINAEAFLRFATKRQAISMMSMGAVSFLGTDCHNMTTRMPNMAEALGVIEGRLGRDTIEELMKEASARLDGAEALA